MRPDAGDVVLVFNDVASLNVGHSNVYDLVVAVNAFLGKILHVDLSFLYLSLFVLAEYRYLHV